MTDERKFTVTFYFNGTEREITWHKGELFGYLAAVTVLEAVAEGLSGHPVGPAEGPYTIKDHLRNPLSALALMIREFGPLTSIKGDIPRRVDMPRGMMA